jgi:hypothetical protein
LSDELAEQVAGVGALVEPARRELYLYVGSQREAVSRERAATAVGVPLHSAKFHLDRLVEEAVSEGAAGSSDSALQRTADVLALHGLDLPAVCTELAAEPGFGCVKVSDRGGSS